MTGTVVELGRFERGGCVVALPASTKADARGFP